MHDTACHMINIWSCEFWYQTEVTITKDYGNTQMKNFIFRLKWTVVCADLWRTFFTYPACWCQEMNYIPNFGHWLHSVLGMFFLMFCLTHINILLVWLCEAFISRVPMLVLQFWVAAEAFHSAYLSYLYRVHSGVHSIVLFLFISTMVDHSVFNTPFSHDAQGGVYKQSALPWSELTVKSLSSTAPILH